LRFAVDTGGTFTDLVVDDGSGALCLCKSPTTPDDPIRGVLDVLDVAARDRGIPRSDLLARGELLIHGTTRAINAILTGVTATTAFLTTSGHPDILLYREGGRTEPFNFTRAYPEPYVPRALTYQVPERVGADGAIVRSLDEDAVMRIIEQLRSKEVEAVAVCLLWSIINPTHELRVGELLEQHLPNVPCTLSHRLNPSLREYRRASSAAIDASLKPVMTDYLTGLEARLADAGFRGRVLVVTSAGGVLDGKTVGRSPIHTIGSGPAMAPVAGRHYAEVDAGASTAVVADTGGTSFDVSLVRRGRIPWTRETWLGVPYFGHMTGFPSVDVKSIGAGGGSIAWVDEGGLLHVGPQSAGSVPGPACYGQGGKLPTVTDSCVVLGYLDPDFFLGGAMRLDRDKACESIEQHVGGPLQLDVIEAAAAILRLTTEHMVRAIEEITLNQGLDPSAAVLVGGGGAAGFNAVAIARQLGCPQVVIPAVGAVLSAAGALMSDLVADFAAALFTTSGDFDFAGVNAILDRLEQQCQAFADGPGSSAIESGFEFTAEARYPHQIWELEVPLPVARFGSAEDVEQLRDAFHAVHADVFAVADPDSPIEIIGWRARVRSRLWASEHPVITSGPSSPEPNAVRRAYFPGVGLVDATVLRVPEVEPGVVISGPAIFESASTTVVVDADASAVRTASGSLLINPSESTKPATDFGRLAHPEKGVRHVTNPA
jgi:N-methylhydantoinase A